MSKDINKLFLIAEILKELREQTLREIERGRGIEEKLQSVPCKICESKDVVLAEDLVRTIYFIWNRLKVRKKPPSHYLILNLTSGE